MTIYRTTTVTSIVTETADLLAAGTQDRYLVAISEWGEIDVRNNPARQINPAAKLDFLRLVNDDGQWKLIHLTHNEVIKGEATLSNSFVGALYGMVSDFFDNL